MADDPNATQITLPDVYVTDKPQPQISEGAGGPTSSTPPQTLPQKLEMQTGGAIDLSSFKNTVAPLDQLSSYRIGQGAGLSDPTPAPAAQLTDAMPSPEPAQTTTAQRQDYADQLQSGGVAGPQDYAEGYVADAFDSARRGFPDADFDDHSAQLTNAAKSLAQSLPDPDHLDAYARYIAQQTYGQFLPEATPEVQPDGERKLPGPGFIPGELHTNPALAPDVPVGAPRPLAPGEFVRNPDGSWSSEESTTTEHPTANGKWTNLPTLWLKDGKPYVAHNEDETAELAKQSGLQWPAYASEKAADDAATQRESMWQRVPPSAAYQVPALYGQPPRTQAIANARSNLLNVWARTGTPVQDIVKTANADPFVGQILTADPLPPDEAQRDRDEANNKLTLPDASVDPAKFLMKVAKTIGIEVAHLAEGIVGGLNPDEYMKSERFRMQQTPDQLHASDLGWEAERASPSEWAGFLSQHILMGGPPKPEGAIGTGVGGKPSAAVKEATPTEPLPTPPAPGYANKAPELPAPQAFPAIGDVKVANVKLADDLNRLITNTNADKMESMNIAMDAAKARPDWTTPEFQKQVQTEVEGRMTAAGKEVSPEVQEFLNWFKDVTDLRYETAVNVKRLLGDHAMNEPELSFLQTTEQGYVPHLETTESLAARRGALPEVPAGTTDVITGARRKTLNKFEGSLQQDKSYAFENEGTGQRLWGHTPLDNLKDPISGKKLTYGDPVPSLGEGWSVKRATIDEIEANTKREMNPNYMMTELATVNHLRSVERNLQFLSERVEELRQQGLFVPRGALNSNSKPEAQPFAPPGMVRVDIPQMDGWAHPSLAKTLNDFYNPRNFGALGEVLDKINHFSIMGMFMAPFVHMGNVATHWAVGRGWDWATPTGIGSLWRDGAEAMHDVVTRGPEYQRLLREGAGFQYPSVATQNWYGTIMQKVFHEVSQDEHTWGDYAKSFGLLGAKDLASAMYSNSKSVLWAVNDMFLMQRIKELEGKGMATRDAIFQAERDIPNYRVPSQVLGNGKIGRGISEAMTSPYLQIFGRYRYGQISALGNLVHDLVGNVPMATRWEAVGKATVLGVMAMGIWPLINKGLQQVTGDPNAKLRPFGALSIPQAMYGLAAGQKSLGSFLDSLVSIAPYLRLGAKLKGDLGDKKWQNMRTQDKIAKLVEDGIGQTYPGQLLLDVMRGTGSSGWMKALGQPLGVSFSKPYVPTQAQQNRATGEANSEARNDAFITETEKSLGLSTPPAVGGGSGGGQGGPPGKSKSGL